MQSPMTPEPNHEAAAPAAAKRVITEPDFSGEPVPIGQWTERENFPQCALGAYVSIHGFAGVIVEIISQSIRVMAPDGKSQRFNAYRLKTLFAPPDRSRPSSPPPSESPKPVAAPRPAATEDAEDEAEPVVPERVFIAKPDFTQPVRAIRTFASQPDFPKCAYGKHVEIPGYAGVVVEIVKGSLKVRSEQGTTRSFNADALKRLYGRP